AEPDEAIERNGKGGKAPPAGEVQRAVGPHEPRPADPDLWMLVHVAHERGERARRHQCIGIEEQVVAAPGSPQRQVVPKGVAAVAGCSQQRDLGKGGGDRVGAAILGGVVHYENLGGGRAVLGGHAVRLERGEALEQPVAGVVVDNDNREIEHRRCRIADRSVRSALPGRIGRATIRSIWSPSRETRGRRGSGWCCPSRRCRKMPGARRATLPKTPSRCGCCDAGASTWHGRSSWRIAWLGAAGG